MRKIGLITLYENSYGSTLQCYATKTYLEQHGYVCELIDQEFHGIHKIFHKLSKAIEIIHYSIRYKGFWENRKALLFNKKVSRTTISPESKQKRDYFIKTVLQPKKYDNTTINDARFQETFDFFITGSDQVWGGGYLVDPIRFLSFAENRKKIALSPSFGTGEIRTFNEALFRKSISQFSCLSAREYSGVEIIKKLTGRTVPRTADPVMLLTADEWSDFAKKYSEISYLENGHFVCVHFIDHPNVTTVHWINMLAKEHNMKILCFAYKHKEFEEFDEYLFIDGGPGDYVEIIKDSSIVFSDSFHTIIFSIVFNKQFYVFERNYQHENRQNARLETLTQIYHCSDRLVRTENDAVLYNKDSDSNYDIIRTEERANIINYLNSCLNIDEIQHENLLGNNTTNKESLIPSLKSIEECTGCMSCLTICPVNSINVNYSDFGYRLPVVNIDKCIHCHRCETVCRRINHDSAQRIQTAYIAYNRNCDLQMLSASGGAFSAIAKSMIEQGGVAVGARLTFNNGKPMVEHHIIDRIEDIPSLLGSKYVESNCQHVYKPVAEYLKKERKVLFCGTSCQVKALYSFLKAVNVSTDKLYTIDLICHGVPGIQLFQDYLLWLEEKYGGKIVDFKFRNKTYNRIDYCEVVTFDIRGTLKTVVIQKEKSPYFEMFINCESYREQCYHCKYARLNKPADITIGDYFEARKDYPELFDAGSPLYEKYYINSMIVHSKKGDYLLGQYGEELALKAVDPIIVQMSHRQLYSPSIYTKTRFDGLAAYKNQGIDGLKKVTDANVRIQKINKMAFRMVKTFIK